MRSVVIFLSLILVFNGVTQAQQKKEAENSYVLLGQKAVMDGDFKLAVTNLEKSLPSNGNNPEVLYMLGYSYYHSGDLPKAISSFTKVISIRPDKADAYYYRGKARNTLGTQLNSSLPPVEREKLLKAGISDFTKGIELNKEQGLEYYQNRALANRDYAELKEQKIPNFFDKAVAQSAYKASISDFQHILDISPDRKDIAEELKKVKTYLAILDSK
jgi:tetratricopeptide (TPR) repeat protein